jgi:hypothetical protein
MSQLIELKPGQLVTVNGKIYGRCLDCKELVRFDKWLISSLHYCVPTKPTKEVR